MIFPRVSHSKRSLGLFLSEGLREHFDPHLRFLREKFVEALSWWQAGLSVWGPPLRRARSLSSSITLVSLRDALPLLDKIHNRPRGTGRVNMALPNFRLVLEVHYRELLCVLSGHNYSSRASVAPLFPASDRLRGDRIFGFHGLNTVMRSEKDQSPTRCVPSHPEKRPAARSAVPCFCTDYSSTTTVAPGTRENDAARSARVGLQLFLHEDDFGSCM